MISGLEGGYVGIIGGLYRDYRGGGIGILAKNMETAIVGLHRV